MMQKKGFTIIELLVVVAIIGLLASIISVSLLSSRGKGRDAKRISDIRTLQLSLETYFSDNGYYPATLSVLQTQNYLPSIPTDPNTGAGYFYTAYNSNNYSSSNCSTAYNVGKYHLGALLESCDVNSSFSCTTPDNSGLRQDTDYAPPAGAVKCSTSPNASFHGFSVNCNGGNSAGAYDSCYDVTN